MPSENQENSKNKIAVVTGGGRGLGRNTVVSLAKRGVDVILTYNTNKAEAESAVAEIEREAAGARVRLLGNYLHGVSVGDCVAAAAAIALVWAPSDSSRYWSHTVFHTDRIGDLAGGINQSVNGLWIRLLGSGGGEQLVWAASVLVLTALAWVAISRARTVGGDVLGATVELTTAAALVGLAL